MCPGAGGDRQSPGDTPELLLPPHGFYRPTKEEPQVVPAASPEGSGFHIPWMGMGAQGGMGITLLWFPLPPDVTMRDCGIQLSSVFLPGAVGVSSLRFKPDTLPWKTNAHNKAKEEIRGGRCSPAAGARSLLPSTSQWPTLAVQSHIPEVQHRTPTAQHNCWWQWPPHHSHRSPITAPGGWGVMGVGVSLQEEPRVLSPCPI